MTHPAQLLDGTDIAFFIGQLTPPNRPSAVINNSIISFIGEPTMLPVSGVTTATLTLDKNNQSFRLFADDGWKQCKILSRAFKITLTSYFVNGISSATPTLEPAFTILNLASLAKESEIFVKFRKFIGHFTVGTLIYDTFYICAGTVKVIEFSEVQPADGLIELNLTLAGEGKLYTGTTNVLSPLNNIDFPVNALFVNLIDGFVLDDGQALAL